MAIYLVNFARGDWYKTVQEKQNSLLRHHFNDIFQYDDDFLKDSGYYRRNKETIDMSITGYGYCGWKGEIILHAMSKVPDDSIVFYSDVADEIYNPKFYDWLIMRTDQMGGKFFNLNYYNHGQWTKRDCFVAMNCDTEQFWNHRQLEAGTIALRKQRDNIAFLKEWSRWCEKGFIIDKSPNTLGKENLAGFVDHRCDQSILTNLVINRGWETEYMENIRAFIKYNEFDKELGGLEKHIK